MEGIRTNVTSIISLWEMTSEVRPLMPMTPPPASFFERASPTTIKHITTGYYAGN